MDLIIDDLIPELQHSASSMTWWQHGPQVDLDQNYVISGNCMHGFQLQIPTVRSHVNVPASVSTFVVLRRQYTWGASEGKHG